MQKVTAYLLIHRFHRLRGKERKIGVICAICGYVLAFFAIEPRL